MWIGAGKSEQVDESNRFNYVIASHCKPDHTCMYLICKIVEVQSDTSLCRSAAWSFFFRFPTTEPVSFFFCCENRAVSWRGRRRRVDEPVAVHETMRLEGEEISQAKSVLHVRTCGPAYSTSGSLLPCMRASKSSTQNITAIMLDQDDSTYVQLNNALVMADAALEV
jgi:hypothetical protein